MNSEILEYNGINPMLLRIKQKVQQNLTLTSDEIEYYETNFMFGGRRFDLTLKVGEKSKELLNKQFGTNKDISEIKIDGLWGETSKIYHFIYKKQSFFTYKEDTESPYLREIQNVEFNAEKYNSDKRKLFDYQIDGVKFLKLRNPAFNWDETGTGKTTMSVVAALDCGFKKILVVTLASLKINWRREIALFNATSKIISGSAWDDSDAQFTIINYDILKNFVNVKKSKNKKENNYLLEEQFDCVIFDEIHRAKNPQSILSNAISQITGQKTMQKVIGLSGTPFEKNIDFYNICRSINANVDTLCTNSKWFQDNIKNYREYVIRYCNAFEQVLDSKKSKSEKLEIESQFSDEIKNLKSTHPVKRYQRRLLNYIQQYGSKNKNGWYFELDLQKVFINNITTAQCEKIINRNLEDKRKKVLVLGRVENGVKVENTKSLELNQRIKHLQIRRTKHEVIHNFPEKFVMPLYFGLNPYEVIKYNDLWREYLEEKNSKKYTDAELEQLSQSIKIRQFLATLKVPHTLGFAESRIEDGYKIIIFTHFKEEYELILDGLGKKAIGINASMSPEKKQEKIDLFQNSDDIRVIVGNIKTLGTGHNLTKGDIVIVNTPNWNSGEHEQSEDRAWRLGRTDEVNVYYALFEGTHEEDVYNRSLSKKQNKEILLSK